MKKKQVQNQAQDGRSMVEMLGVLAIIAILSIGGIVGYKLAMNYYQANQIAHEMNMMRTDAQIKIAQGAEKLTLGSPYDDKKINFNDYGTDFDCVYMENENATPDPAFCTGANAYYIEMQNIPEGVCKPLANLIDNMDNEIAFYINEKSVDGEGEEKGACNEEFNTLRVIFGADSDSEAIKCNGEGDPDCPAELPVCLNHVCVECEKDEDCLAKGTENPICNTTEGKCKPCPDGQQWKKSAKGCVPYECRTNEDCKNGEYCYLGTGLGGENGCELEFSDEPGPFFSGQCHSVESDSTDEIIISNEQTQTKTKYFGSQIRMNWWSACRFCAAKTHVSDSPCDSSIVSEPDFIADYSVLQCADLIDIAAQETGYCHATSIGNTNNVNSNISPVVVQLKTLSGFSSNDAWLRNDYTGCRVANVRISNGLVHHTARGNSAFHGVAFCKGEEVR